MTFDDWWGAYPTQEDYEANCRDAWEASAASRNAEVTELRKLIGEIYCSDDTGPDVMRKIEDVLSDIANLNKENGNVEL